jgi:hypothetical protein
MTLTPDQINTLLQIAARYDRRTIGPSDIDAWLTASRIGRWATREDLPDGTWRWSPALAEAAIHKHFATSTAWLMPAHITELVAVERRTLPPVGVALPPAGPPASQATRDAVTAAVAALADRKAIPAAPGGGVRALSAARRRAVLAVRCGHCGAGPGDRCHTGGRPLRRQFAHPARVTAAGSCEDHTQDAANG